MVLITHTAVRGADSNMETLGCLYQGAVLTTALLSLQKTLFASFLADVIDRVISFLSG